MAVGSLLQTMTELSLRVDCGSMVSQLAFRAADKEHELIDARNIEPLSWYTVVFLHHARDGNHRRRCSIVPNMDT